MGIWLNFATKIFASILFSAHAKIHSMTSPETFQLAMEPAEAKEILVSLFFGKENLVVASFEFWYHDALVHTTLVQDSCDFVSLWPKSEEMEKCITISHRPTSIVHLLHF